MNSRDRSGGSGRRSSRFRRTRETAGEGRAPWKPAALGGIVVAVVLIAVVTIALLNMQAPTGAPRAAAQDTTVRAPTNLVVFTADREVVVSWHAARPVPDGYRVYRATGRRGPYELLGTVNAPDINTFTDDSHFTLGAIYSYTVTSFNNNSESAPVGPAAIAVTAASLHLPATPSPTLPPPRPVPTFDASNAIPAVDEGTPGPAPTPLPTFQALTRAELTAIAREPTKRAKHATPRATPYGGISALLTPTATSVATAATTVGPTVPAATAVTTVGPAATPIPSAIGVSTPIATPTVLPPVVTVTATATPTS